MIGRTLGLYFLRRYAAITTWNFLGIAALIFIVTFTEVASRTSNLDGYSTSWALMVSAFQLPILMQQAVPFIALIAAMTTLISLNRKYELVIARAAGISAWQFLTPILFGAFLLGLFTLFVVNPIASLGFSRAEVLQAEVRGSKISADSEHYRWLKQRTDEGDIIIGAEGTMNEGLTLVRPTFILFGDEGQITERINADRATLGDKEWILVNSVRMRDGAPAEHLETFKIMTNLRQDYVRQELTDPLSLSIFELPQRISEAKAMGLRVAAFSTHLHTLLALPVLLVAMSLIAATVSMRFTRLGQSGAMILGGIFAGFLLYVVSVLVKAFGQTGIVMPAIAAWSPVVVAMFFGITFLLFKEDG